MSIRDEFHALLKELETIDADVRCVSDRFDDLSHRYLSDTISREECRTELETIKEQLQALFNQKETCQRRYLDVVQQINSAALLEAIPEQCMVCC